MAKTYEDEQRQLESRKVELDAFIATAKEQRLSVDSFLDMVRKYTDITELTAEIIRTFVEKIEVMKPEKVPGTRTKKQTIVITGISSELSRSPIPKRKRHNQNNA